MYVQPSLKTTRKENPLNIRTDWEESRISSSQAVFFVMLAIGSVAFLHIQALESTSVQASEFAVHAFSNESDFFAVDERENAKKHFTSDTKVVTAADSSLYTYEDDRIMQKNHFSADTSGVVSSLTDGSPLLLDERSNTRNHFQYGLI